MYNLMSDGMHTLKIFEQMQSRGMLASRTYFESLADEMRTEMYALQDEISVKYYDSQPFNPKSPIHVRNLMAKYNIVGSEFTEKLGEMSTSKSSIEHLRTNHPVIDAIFNYREREHNLDMYCAEVLNIIPEDVDLYIVRTNLKTTRTTTRRLASERPNWLATPNRTELGLKIRNGYISRPGMIFTEHDLSQAELRCLAHESADPLMCRSFIAGVDIHAQTASQLFGIPISTAKEKKYRTPAKTINFGIVYGMAAEALQRQLRTQNVYETIDECDRLLTEWFKIYAGVKEYKSQVILEVKHDGLVRDCSGMIRYLSAINHRDPGVAAEAGRFAVSQRIQGMAQTMIQNSMRWIDDELVQPCHAAVESGMTGVGVWWLLQIHDSLMLEIDEDEELFTYVNAMMIEGLTKHCGMHLRVPVLADGKRGKTWGSMVATENIN